MKGTIKLRDCHIITVLEPGGQTFAGCPRIGILANSRVISPLISTSVFLNFAFSDNLFIVEEGCQFERFLSHLDLMAQWCTHWGVEVWAYCLMPNHVHLIAVPPSEDALIVNDKIKYTSPSTDLSHQGRGNSCISHY